MLTTTRPAILLWTTFNSFTPSTLWSGAKTMAMQIRNADGAHFKDTPQPLSHANVSGASELLSEDKRPQQTAIETMLHHHCVGTRMCIHRKYSVARGCSFHSSRGSTFIRFRLCRLVNFQSWYIIYESFLPLIWFYSFIRDFMVIRVCELNLARNYMPSAHHLNILHIRLDYKTQPILVLI